jgi:hypothetical protein
MAKFSREAKMPNQSLFRAAVYLPESIAPTFTLQGHWPSLGGRIIITTNDTGLHQCFEVGKQNINQTVDELTSTLRLVFVVRAESDYEGLTTELKS